MYKIIMLQETDYMGIYFIFFARLTGNQLILMYYFMLDGQYWLQEREDGDWLQLFSLVQPYIIAGVCDGGV